MSSLDHNLVCGNSLTGIGSVEEALDVLVPGRKGKATLFDEPIEKALESARTVLVDAAMLAEATKDESRAASRAAKKAYKDAEKARLLFDAAVLTRIGREGLVAAVDPDAIAKLAAQQVAQDAILSLKPAHMPALFPEVFLRENGGFDVLIGNPPWEEVMVEEPKYWLRVQPGILGLNAADLKAAVVSLRKKRPELIAGLEKEIENAAIIRKVLLAGPFPGLGTGDVDLYRVFAWRNWQLLRAGGRFGQVFPRSVLTSAGSAKWRETVLANGSGTIATLINTKGWVFPSVTYQYNFVLFDVHKDGNPQKHINYSGPFSSQSEFEKQKSVAFPIQLKLLNQAATGLSLPQLPDAESVSIFSVIRLAPRLDDERHPSFRPVREFDATNDRSTFDAGPQKDGRWPVLGGSGFNLWQPDTGDVYAWAEPRKVIAALQEKRQRQIRLKSSAFYGMDEVWAKNLETLPCRGVRIAFRDIARATDPRTCIVSLIAPETILTNKAPYLLNNGGSPKDEAYLLGILSSVALDWYSKRYVELGMNLHIFNGLPIPLCDSSDFRRLRVIEISGRLAAVDSRFTNWAKDVGVKVGSVKTNKDKESLIGELDALVAHLYGLSRSQLEHVFKTFHRNWDYSSRLEQVLAFYDQLPKVKS
jgi:hypothetical protein